MGFEIKEGVLIKYIEEEGITELAVPEGVESIGENAFRECENLEYDDYGKVRNYLDENKGTPITVIARDTGVSKWTIRQMVEEERFDICPTVRRVLK